MKKKNKKSLIVVSLFIFLILIGVFYFLYKEIQKKNIQAEKIINEWQLEDLRRKEIEAIIKSVEIIKEDNEVIQSHFAKKTNLVPLLDTIDGFAPKVGGENQITSIEVIPETKELIVGMRTLGSFESIYRFLSLLENSPYEIEFILTNIQKMALQNNGSTGIKSEKTGKFYSWEGSFKIKLLSFIP